MVVLVAMASAGYDGNDWGLSTLNLVGLDNFTELPSVGKIPFLPLLIVDG